MTEEATYADVQLCEIAFSEGLLVGETEEADLVQGLREYYHFVDDSQTQCEKEREAIVRQKRSKWPRAGKFRGASTGN